MAIAKARRAMVPDAQDLLRAEMGSVPVDRVDADAILAVLRPVWAATPETARRVRARIENVLDAAKAAGRRQGENPARWKGNLAHRLPGRADRARSS